MTAPSLFDLTGRTAFVTGATGHLGAKICRALAQAGATVIANARDTGRLSRLVDGLTAEGLAVESALVDLSNHAAIRAYFQRQQGRAIGIIVNNAYAGGAGTSADATPARFTQAVDIAVAVPASILQAGLPNLRVAVARDGDASVINMSSMYGHVSPDIGIYETAAAANPPEYGAAKAALLQWTRYTACEFGREGIRVNAISPGPFPSPAARARDPDLMRRLAGRVPLQRLGEPHEIAGPVVFLASHASSFVNGANLVVDGGWTAW